MLSTRSRLRTAFLFAPTISISNEPNHEKNSTFHEGDSSMMSNRLRMIIATMTVVLLLTPALIWSDRHASRSAVGNNSIKLPPASTIGSGQYSYTPTPLEIEKRHQIESFAWPSRDTRGLPRLNTPPANAAYPGMTPAEIEKLARMRETGTQSIRTIMGDTTGPVTRTDNIPRAPGVEGLTPRERAKLEQYAKDQE
jgi:hypothetical protein